MELVCDSVEDDYTIHCMQECDAVEDTPVPQTAHVESQRRDDGSMVHTIVLDALAAKRMRSPSLSETPTENRKRTLDCRVVVKKLPQSLDQNSKIFVSGSSDARSPILKSHEVARAVPARPFILPNLCMKAEADEPNDSENGQRALMPHPTAERNSAGSGTIAASLPGNTGGTCDISVVLLSSSQTPEAAASDAADPAAPTRPRDVSTLIQDMLRRQNLSLQSLGNDSSVTSMRCDENGGERGMMLVSSPGVSDNAARLRNMLQVYQRRNAVLEKKLKAEQARVRYLLAEVNSLKTRPTPRGAPMENNSRKKFYFRNSSAGFAPNFQNLYTGFHRTYPVHSIKTDDLDLQTQ